MLQRAGRRYRDPHHPAPVLAALLGREVSVREAFAREHRWAKGRFLVATASPTLGLGPAEAAWLPLGQTWPPLGRIERRGELTAVA